MEISYRSIITKFNPEPPEGEEYYKKTLKKINEILQCLDLKLCFDAFLKLTKPQSSDIYNKFTKLIIQIIREYDSPEFGKIIRTPQKIELLKNDAIFSNCRSIEHILKFYINSAEVLDIKDINPFLNSFYISRLCLFYKQLYQFEQIFTSITKTFGPDSENTTCLTDFFLNQNDKYFTTIKEIINNYDEINSEQIYTDAVHEITNYSKEEKDAKNLYDNYLLQIFDNPQLKELDEKLLKLQTGIYNSSKAIKYSKIQKQKKLLIKKLTEERFSVFLDQITVKDKKDYWNKIYHKYIENNDICNLASEGVKKSTNEMLREAINLSINEEL